MSLLELEHTVAFLREKWKGRDSKCQMCGNRRWELPSNTFQLVEYSEGDLVVGGPIIPVIPLTCNKCGNTLLINALVAGREFQPDDEEDEEDEIGDEGGQEETQQGEAE